MNITVNNPFVLTWLLTDSEGNPINNATLTATLYAGRTDPAVQPGVPVTGLSDVTLTYVPDSAGEYSASIPAFSAPLGSNYVLVVEASVSSTIIYHDETPVVLVTRNDLVTQPTLPIQVAPAPPAGSFQPRYIFDFELQAYGLPSPASLPTILTLVDAASSLIDSYCGRIDGGGTGSLVYTTYEERQLLPQGRNLTRVTKPPLVALDSAFVATLASYNTTGYQGVMGNHFWTGVQPNTIVQPAGNLTSILAASGRYGYGRRDQQMTYPDLNYGANILQVAAFFGGPPQWTGIDPSMIDVFEAVGELWIPAGLYLASYTEVLIRYNAGYNPMAMPNNIKQATAALVKNFITRSGGVTALLSYSAGRLRTQFTPALIDPTIEQWLKFYQHVVSM